VPYAGFAFCVALSVFVFVSRLFCVLDRLVGRGRSTVWWCAVIGPRIVISWFVVLSLARSALLLTHPFVSWDLSLSDPFVSWDLSLSHPLLCLGICLSLSHPFVSWDFG